MREILFRGQTRRYGERLMNVAGDKMPSNWVYGGVFPNNSGGQRAIIYQQHPDVAKFPVYAETVGQYIGILDKHKMKIFEEDICRVTSAFTGRSVVYAVKYSQTDCCFGFMPLNSGYIYSINELLESILGDEITFEVIGNVFDNPELLVTDE